MSLDHQTAQGLIAALDLAPHPEGGHYRQTWKAESSGAKARAAGTAIYFLLEAGQKSEWHRVDAVEIWLFHAGAPLILRRYDPASGRSEAITLGPDPRAGHQPQAIIAPGQWQSAGPSEGYALVSCVVVPGFEFTGFTLAAADEARALDQAFAAALQKP